MNMSELSAFEQALTNFIGYWEDDEERWPSKFVKKHGKHILDMARDELQKEQIPYIDFVIKPHRGDDTNPYDMSVSEAQEYAIKRGFGVPFNDGEVYVDERHITQTIGNILRWADEHPKEQKPIQTDAEKEYVRTLKSLVADFVRANNYIERGYYQQIYDWLDGRHIEQKPVEIHIDNPNIQRFDPDVKVTTSDSSASGKELLYVSNKSYKIGYRDGVNSVKPAEWSEEDEKIITRLISYFESFRIAGVATKWEGLDIQEVITLLKSLRPSWKPTEEQMKCLLNAEGLIRTDKRLAMAQKLAELYEQLKKLM